MKRQTLYVLVALLTVFAMSASIFWPFKMAKDDALYFRMRQLSLGYECITLLRQHLPNSVGQPFHLLAVEQRCWAKEEAIREKLLASGYLTKVRIAVPPSTSISRQTVHRLCQANRTTGAKWELSRPTPAEIVLTCRPRDTNLWIGVLRRN